MRDAITKHLKIYEGRAIRCTNCKKCNLFALYYDKRTMKMKFKLTCPGCPEQYDVLNEEGKQIAYVRLRWGGLTIDCPDYNGEEIYFHDFKEEYKGNFKDAKEKERYMKIIGKKIEEYYKKGSPSSSKENQNG